MLGREDDMGMIKRLLYTSFGAFIGDLVFDSPPNITY
jgi:hypothetical protein